MAGRSRQTHPPDRYAQRVNINEWLDAALELIRSVDPVLRTLLAGLGILLETSILVGLVIPGDSIVLVASTAVQSPAEYFGLIAAILIGAICGESIGFALGRFFGPKIRHSWLGRRIGEKNWHRAEVYLERRGGPAVFISRFLPVLHSIIPLTVGMSTMSYRRFISWTVPACILWSCAYVSVGAFAAGSYEQLSDRLHYAGYLFVGIIVVFIVGVVLVRRALARSQQRHMTESRSAENSGGAPE